MSKPKKLIIFIVALLCVLPALASCSDNSSLEGKLTDLEQKNSSLEEQLKSKSEVKDLNVYWTAKDEYAEDETVEVYFGNTKVYSVKITDTEIMETQGGVILVRLEVYSYFLPISKEVLFKNTYLRWNSGIFTDNRAPYYGEMIEINTANNLPVWYRDAQTAIDTATRFDLMLCAPGISFPIATIKNITINL